MITATFKLVQKKRTDKKIKKTWQNVHCKSKPWVVGVSYKIFGTTFTCSF